jgi:alkylhydroperoxidase family enzyme
MQARMKNPAMLIPGAVDALRAVSATYDKAGVPAKLLHLVHLRASQLNGCSFCVDMHSWLSKDETPERMLTTAVWRDAPYFTPPERAALALTEAVTHIDPRDPVPDAVWAEASRHFDETQLAAILLSIAMANTWNRLNIATRQVAGAKW